MAEVNISQTEADALLAMEKHRIDDTEYDYPVAGGKLSVPLLSTDKRESFILDLRQGRIRLTKRTYQTRARQVVVLVRLDLDGPSHPNPDGEEVRCPHLHVYREDYGDKWAIPVPEERFTSLTDARVTLDHFLAFCNVTIPPKFVSGIFG